MNWKTTLALAAVALAIFAYFRFFELKQPSTEEATRQAQNVVNFDQDKIDQIVIQNGDDKIEMRRHDSKWRLETPIKDQAEAEAQIDRAGSVTGNFIWERRRPRRQDVCALRKFKGNVSRCPNHQKRHREKARGISRQEIDRSGHDASLARRVKDARGDLHPYGLAEPRGVITLFGPDDKQGEMLQIGSVPEKEKDQVYVRSAPRGFVYTLPKKIEEILNIKPDDLRDRHLVRIDTNILDRITI